MIRSIRYKQIINTQEAFALKTRVWSVRLSVLAVVAAFLSLSVLPTDAEARRLGGGGSFGRTAPSQFQKTTPTSPSGTTSTAPSKQQATNSGTSTTGAAAPRNRFLGPLGGLAAGLGLAALFGYLGFGAGMAEFLGTMLLIAAAVFAVVFLVRMLRGQQASKQRPAYSVPGGSVGNSNSYRQGPVNDPVPGMGQPGGNQGFGQFGNADAFDAPMPASTPLKELPAGFDEANFVNSAKKFFVTMQGVFDKGDVAGLREYCSDEVVDHLKTEIESRGNTVNRTDVVTLDAQLIGFETDVDEQIATVAFTGMLREEQDAAAAEINELWIMSRPVSGGGWVLSGIHNL
ncbi:MAG: 39S ribosomal protein L45 [Gammaproteobacteria bacterium]|uniref:Tim44 domain-containing protein n=1 Tax=Limnobacter sp. TaxID=2003368 RepID=UPI001DBECD34|nr:TIM44-like domain-containing protein [Limnobacter sp.]MBU0784479.1 39S ribosomal protein L45 [Gammaproteobacteria bacterium]MBU0847864.1 39S ribosomal protein L45 [Gammaproteobacteria bacterium]MBU1268159.1 39S ribosomal protein L45 [Gammaproteobacteria bacterium]MBU1527932.1 39S ribosomal protein L45 [Gammaproteobacteria bacterium]MBU1780099.1 39S ribosomal protein L45 [Gammaproteobacteria bacterium]